MKEKIAALGNELEDAKKWEEEGQTSAAARLSDWARTQIRSVGTYLGRARRETFDCRIKP